MKKILALILTCMVIAAGIPVYADVTPENLEDEAVEEISLNQEIGMLLAEVIELYMTLDGEDDEEIINELTEELQTGFRIILSKDSDEEEMKESIESMGSILLEHEEKVKNEMIREREELLDEISKLEEGLKNGELGEEETKNIKEELEVLYTELIEMDKEFGDYWDEEENEGLLDEITELEKLLESEELSEEETEDIESKIEELYDELEEIDEDSEGDWDYEEDEDDWDDEEDKDDWDDEEDKDDWDDEEDEDDWDDEEDKDDWYDEEDEDDWDDEEDEDDWDYEEDEDDWYDEEDEDDWYDEEDEDDWDYEEDEDDWYDEEDMDD